MEANKKSDKNGPSNPSPREKASIFSYILFIWILPIFFKGRKRTLDESDLYDPLTTHRSFDLGDKLCNAWNKRVEESNKTNKDPSLLSAGIDVFGKQLILGGVLMLILELGVRMSQPFFIMGVVSYFAEEDEKSAKEGYLYAAGLITCSALNVMMIHPIMLSQSHLGMKMRIASISMIYRKTLRLTQTALGETTAGQVVNLLSNDVGRFETSILFIHYLWIAPIELIAVSTILYQFISYSSLIGVAFLVLFVPIQVLMGSIGAKLRLKTALRTDQRVRFMNEIIQGIQVIKMYAWEKPFAKVVDEARRSEINVIRKVSYIRGSLLSFMMFTSRVSIFMSLAAYVILGNAIDAKTAFVVTAYYNLLRNSMTMLFPQGIYQLAETLVSVGRIQKFMMYEELDKIESSSSTEEGASDKPFVELQNISAKWEPKNPEYTLNNVSLSIDKPMLVAVIGPVGSGKSSIIQTILRELKLELGTVKTSGVMSYSSQEPWLFSSSIRQNILFGLPMDRERYKLTVQRCALERDFSLFPNGDRTIVGERGASLSGGQKARINLARAVYRKADIYLLDDPLSAVDTHVGRHLFNDCIKKLLGNRITILVTHQVQYLQEADHIILMEKGKVSTVGSYDSLSKSGLDFTKLLANPEGDKEEKQNEVKKRTMSTSSVTSDKRLENKKRDSIMSAASVDVDIPSVDEKRDEGSIAFTVYKQYFNAAGGWCTFAFVFLLFLLAQTFASGSDYFLQYWVDKSERMEVDLYPTKGPYRQENGWFEDFKNDEYFDIYIFGILTLLTVIVSFTRTFVFFNAAMQASRRLHTLMFNGITKATLYFFHTNSSGRILNRFSKDMGQVDEILPAIFIDMIQIFLQLFAIIILLIIINPYLAILTCIIIAMFMVFRSFYLKTSTSIKRLEATSRSPIYGHLTSSLSGLSTIRSFNAEEILMAEFDSHQDRHSSAYYLFIAAARTFGFWLDSTCVLYIALTTLSFFLMDASGGKVGLAVTQVIGMTGMVQWGMRQSAELENTMTSVERIVEYNAVDPEPPLDSTPDNKPPNAWPEKGIVVFDNLSLRYVPDKEANRVLKDLTFTIGTCEKIGIVGRTGAGKSSLINAIFRLSYNEGEIRIDNRNTEPMGLHDLRSKISIIPQEPVLFSGSLRYNLDPFDEYNDEKLWTALSEVKLKEVIKELPAGLHSKITEGGSNFSVGQRQLVCLARAILRENKILVMDEATANVDPQTDALIQETIRTKFANCTVLTIAHRLNTILDSDKVLVMDAGRCVEFGSPYELLTTESGPQVFVGMVKQTGNANYQQFLEIAEKNHKERALSS